MEVTHKAAGFAFGVSTVSPVLQPRAAGALLQVVGSAVEILYEEVSIPVLARTCSFLLGTGRNLVARSGW